MKIAVWHNLPSGGAKRALYYHVRGLVERGHEVEAWCPPTASQEYLPLNSLITEHVVPLAWPPPERHSALGRLRGRFENISYKIEVMHRHAQQCAEVINQGNFDLLLGNGYDACIGQYVKIPKVLYLQEPCRILYEAITQSPPQLPWIAPAQNSLTKL